MTSLAMHLGFLIVVSVVVAASMAVTRLPTRESIIRETLSFSTKLVLGIVACAAIVVVLEWAFVRRIV